MTSHPRPFFCCSCCLSQAHRALPKNRKQEHFRLLAKLLMLSFRQHKRQMSRRWRQSSEQGKRSLRRAMRRKTKLEREQFIKKYQEMHRLVQEPDGSTVLYIGAENWPFPVPLVSRNGQWYFDSDHGKQEILFRRIGENEATAMDVCEEFAMANNASAAKAASNDPIAQFAESLVSGAATADNKESNPYHGYYFRVLTRNSPVGGQAGVGA